MKPCKKAVGTPYGAKGSMWAGGIHKGVDFKCPLGTPVLAPWNGRVTIHQWGRAFGKHLVIDFERLPDGSPGYWGVLAHLSHTKVTPGTVIKMGQLLGLSGNTGNSSGPHLHFEIQKGAQWSPTGYTDPQRHLSAGYLQSGKVYSNKMVEGVEDSDSVRNLQRALLFEGYDPGANGTYDEKTVAAVSKYQKSLGYTGSNADGIAGKGTIKNLCLLWVEEEVA